MKRFAIASLAMLVSAATAAAQQPTQPRPAPQVQTPRRQEVIEIRGQVPTPQVVTVRPREAPAYSRRVLVPAFFDHDFWPSILPPLQIVSPAWSPRADSTSRATADSTARPVAPRPSSGTPRAPLRR
jgi:hypothetical protein